MIDQTGANLLPVPEPKPVLPSLAAAGIALLIIIPGFLVSWIGYLFFLSTEGVTRVAIAVAIVLWSMMILVAAAACAIKVFDIVRRRLRVRSWISRKRTRRSDAVPATRARPRTRSSSSAREDRVRRTGALL